MLLYNWLCLHDWDAIDGGGGGGSGNGGGVTSIVMPEYSHTLARVADAARRAARRPAGLEPRVGDFRENGVELGYDDVAIKGTTDADKTQVLAENWDWAFIIGLQKCVLDIGVRAMGLRCSPL